MVHGANKFFTHVILPCLLPSRGNSPTVTPIVSLTVPSAILYLDENQPIIKTRIFGDAIQDVYNAREAYDNCVVAEPRIEVLS